MKNNKYPRIGERRRGRGGICKVCGLPKSDMVIDVQVNQFRGDDDVYKVHRNCTKHIRDIRLLPMLTGPQPKEAK